MTNLGCVPVSPNPTLNDGLARTEEELIETRARLMSIFSRITGREWACVEYTTEGSHLLGKLGLLGAISYDTRLLAVTIFESL